MRGGRSVCLSQVRLRDDDHRRPSGSGPDTAYPGSSVQDRARAISGICVANTSSTPYKAYGFRSDFVELKYSRTSAAVRVGIRLCRLSPQSVRNGPNPAQWPRIWGAAPDQRGCRERQTASLSRISRSDPISRLAGRWILLSDVELAIGRLGIRSKHQAFTAESTRNNVISYYVLRENSNGGNRRLRMQGSNSLLYKLRRCHSRGRTRHRSRPQTVPIPGGNPTTTPPLLGCQISARLYSLSISPHILEK